MMKPKITIGIPFKNPGEYFELALKSVFAQTFMDWELILIDDGSTDSSIAYAQRIYDPRVKLHIDGQSKGLSARLNQMVQLAEAQYFFRMDADDIMHHKRLEIQYQVLIDNDSDTVVGTSAYSINERSQIVGLKNARGEQKRDFYAMGSFIHPTVAASTSWFRKNPYSEEPMYHRSEDTELWCRTSHSSKFINLSDPLLFYRESKFLPVKKYVSSNLGLIFLLVDKYGSPKPKFFFLYVKEVLKLSAALILYDLGLSDYLMVRRYKSLNREDTQIAQSVLSFIFNQELPMFDSLS
jgi:glycosyltransferase involved in cell wall biosynthesis